MIDKFPKITVVTVTFNLIKDGREQFFRQCVESVHNQTYSNIEYLVIDGASTDGTLNIIKEYADKGWIRYVSEPDTGHWDAMNKGAKLADGKYIIYLNSDDYYQSNDILEKAVKKLEETGADYLYGDYYVVDRDDRHREKYYSLPSEFIFQCMTIKHEALVVKKEVYEKIGFYKEIYRTAIDDFLNFELVLNDFSFVFLDEPMFTCRVGGGTTIGKNEIDENVKKDVVKAFKDFYSSFVTLSDKEVGDILWSHIFPNNFFDLFENFIMKKQLKNFNYDFFRSLVEKKDNEVAFLATTKRNFKQKIYLFNIPFVSVVQKSKKRVYKLFGLVPLLKIKEK